MLTNYVYKLRPNISQSDKMDGWLDMLRSTYNWSLADRIAQYNQQFIQGDYCDIRTKAEACPLTCFVSKNGASGEPWKDAKTDKNGNLKNPRRSAGDIQITSLPYLKKARPWFAEIDSTVLQQNVKRLDIAYKNFFEGRGFPKFKNRSNFTSFTYQMGVKAQGNKIYLPKLGWMRFFNSRLILSGFTIKAATLRKRQDGWYVSIRIEDKTMPDYIKKPLNEVNSILGCDLGITKLVHFSDRHQIDNPRFSTNKKARRTLKIRQRRINRKVKGSKNRKKAANKVGRFHKKITDKRTAYQWSVANTIVSRKVDAIALEDLNISGMLRRCKVKTDEKTGRFLKNGQSRKKGLNRSISDASWSDLILKIEYLAVKQGKVVIKINPKYSSQECRNCGHTDKSNRDGEKFICTECGYHEHADIGAAKTIRDRGFKIVRGDSAKLAV
ncbi:transposase [Dolichospermum sp. ST_sed1]|nr:transposase [Dolichospermum sp. ST_sed1]MDD1430366.1 transposase [Dolichospermum sp. ST_sed6]MDD1435868.1 transposase [Dolichospermum sp. ST_sed10]MDD1439698.1 transposase [Dolichospermum sp. ST_sed3]MDD1445033.1 transposase [Dolichospermum sp. ST_sed8]MDD1453754.1 transposase [Dolichospermum sp. ST_sed7]MDD1465110.1 transposase [Dolichospermum sp. ST_sed5]MDD1470881.1 transposase [Dolichospermum sp. ST_sed4]